MDQQEVLALNQRSAMYRLTSRFFRTEITRECLDGLKAAGFPTDNPEENPLAEGFALIRKFIDAPREDPLTVSAQARPRRPTPMSRSTRAPSVS